MKRNSITLIRNEQHLRPKGRADKLPTHAPGPILVILRTLLLRDFFQHLRDGRAILRVEIGIDFVEEVEGRWVALLDCEDEG